MKVLFLSQKCFLSDKYVEKLSLPENSIALVIYTLANTELK